MAKITIQIDEDDENGARDLNFWNNRYKYWGVVDELKRLKREIYKGYYSENDYMIEYKGKLYSPDEWRKETANLNYADIQDVHTLFKYDFVERELDNVLDGVILDITDD